MAMLGCPLDVAASLRDLAVVSIVSDNSSASSMWLHCVALCDVFWLHFCLSAVSSTLKANLLSGIRVIS